eukprot:s5448_g3.t3
MLKLGGEDDEVLQTRIISPQEVSKNWSDWLPAIDAEVGSLLEEKEAMEEVSGIKLQDLLKDAEERGIAVEFLPSKLVFTKKPGKRGGKFKVRLWGDCRDDALETMEVEIEERGSYVRDLLSQSEEEEVMEPKIPITRDQAQLPEEEEEKTPELIRSAQQATGELLWLVTRTRMDLMYAVAKMGSCVVRAPDQGLPEKDHLSWFGL